MNNAGLIFKAISDPTRRKILQMLKDSPLSAGDIAAEFDMTAPSISRHLLTLKSAGLIKERREGNRIIYSLEPESLANCLSDFVSSICPIEHHDAQKKNKKKQ